MAFASFHVFCMVHIWRSCMRSPLSVPQRPVQAAVCVGQWRLMFGVVLLYVRWHMRAFGGWEHASVGV